LSAGAPQEHDGRCRQASGPEIAVRVKNELRTVTVSSRPGRTVEAVVRRRGIEARLGTTDFLVQSEAPVTLIVREPDTLRRVAMPATEDRGRMVAFVAAPVAAAVIARMFRPRRSK